MVSKEQNAFCAEPRVRAHVKLRLGHSGGSCARRAPLHVSGSSMVSKEQRDVYAKSLACARFMLRLSHSNGGSA